MHLPALPSLPVPVFMCDHTAHLTFVNQNWLTALKLPVGEDWTRLFPELDRAAFERHWRQCMQLGQPHRVHYRAQPPGREAAWYELHLQPAITDEGERFMFGALVDITEQTVISAEAHAILDTAADGIIIIDQSGTIEVFNQAACQIFGYSVAEAVGHDVSMLMPTPHREQHAGYITRYLETREPRIIGLGRELTGERKDGTRFPMSLAVSEINLAGEHRFTGIIRDLTEQHTSRQTLAEQRERLAHVGRLSTMGEMTASIAHEINQPLTAISMYAQAGMKLLEGKGDPAKLKEALEKLNLQALRAGAIIERIQRFARAQDGVRELADVNGLLRDLLKLAESDARLHDIQLELELDDALPPMLVDPIQIQQVALNLIRNAIDAMNEIGCPNGRTIVMRSRRLADDQVEVAVQDLGTGVADNQVDLLFTPFHTTKRDGMGMGLSICRSIIHEHGGELSYFNNEGPGATFYFRLPIRLND